MICQRSVRAPDKAQDNHRRGEKLASGRGNVLAQGVRPSGARREIKREINPDLAEQAVTQDEEYQVYDRSLEGGGDEHYPNDERVKQQLS